MHKDNRAIVPVTIDTTAIYDGLGYCKHPLFLASCSPVRMRLPTIPASKKLEKN